MYGAYQPIFPEEEGDYSGAMTHGVNYSFSFAANSVCAMSNGLIVSDVTALQFDPFQELLCVGNSAGKVMSWYGPEMMIHSSFLPLPGSAGIRALEVVEQGVLVVGDDAFSIYTRQGFPLCDYYRSENLTGLLCVCTVPVAEGQSSVLLGGNQDQLVQLDLTTMKEQRLIHVQSEERGCMQFRSNDRFLFSADLAGRITMRAMNSLEPVGSVVAHSGGIADFDVFDNTIITCGSSSRNGAPDPFLKIYDTRNMRALAPIPVCSPPILCRFANPIADGRIIIASKHGQISSMDLNCAHSIEALYQSLDGQMPTRMVVSSSRQCCAVGDSQGTVSLFAIPEFTFNINSWPTSLPVSDDLPPIAIDDLKIPLNSIPTPLPPAKGYCSDYWPAGSLSKVMRLKKML